MYKRVHLCSFSLSKFEQNEWICYRHKHWQTFQVWHRYFWKVSFKLLSMVACNLESEGKFFIRQGLFITLVYLTQKPGNFLWYCPFNPDQVTVSKQFSAVQMYKSGLLHLLLKFTVVQYRCLHYSVFYFL